MGFFSACYNCTDRHQGCHGTCVRYAAARLARDLKLDMKMKRLRPDYELTNREVNKIFEIRKAIGK